MSVKEEPKKYKLIELIQRSPEWLNFRKGKIGASQVGAILGVDPFKTALQLWTDIVFDRKTPVNSAMQRGIDGEDGALEWLNKVEDSVDFDSFYPAVLQSVEYPFLIASLDGFREKDIQAVEIKFPSKKVHEYLLETGRPPERYMPQLQFQMYIGGFDKMFYLSCFQDEKVLRVVERDQKFIDEMIPEILAFRTSIIDCKPPEPVDKDVIQIDDPEAVLKAERFIELDRLIWELSQERDALRLEMTEMAKYQKVQIGALMLSKVIRPGNVNWEAVEALKGIDLTAYRKSPIESWRLSYE